GPFALEKRREREFCKRLGLRFSDEGINGIEQGIFGSEKTGVDLLTKRLQCAKIHASKAPSVFFLNFTLSDLSSQGERPFFLILSSLHQDCILTRHPLAFSLNVNIRASKCIARGCRFE